MSDRSIATWLEAKPANWTIVWGCSTWLCWYPQTVGKRLCPSQHINLSSHLWFWAFLPGSPYLQLLLPWFPFQFIPSNFESQLQLPLLGKSFTKFVYLLLAFPVTRSRSNPQWDMKKKEEKGIPLILCILEMIMMNDHYDKT